MPKYQLLTHLSDLYQQHERSVSSDSIAFFFKNIDRKRSALRRLLALSILTTEKTEQISIQKRESYTLERIDATLSDSTIMPIYFVIPRAATKPYKTIIIHHGHAPGAQTLFGEGMTKEYQDYALAFIEKGYAVLAIDQRGFAGRLGPSPLAYNGYTRSCRQLSFDLLMLGRTLLGERVADGMALVDYALSRADIDHSALVLTGNSGGGTVSLLQMAVDTRVTAGIISSCFCTYEKSIFELSHCECNYIPNIMVAFKEIWEIGALCAPRPLLIIHGKEDAIFPIQGVHDAFNSLSKYYEHLKASKQVALQVHPGPHRYDHGKVFDFLEALGSV